MQSASLPVAKCTYHAREYQKKDTILWIWEKTKLNLKEEKKLTCVQLYISCRMQRGTQCHPLQLHTWPQFVKLSSWHNISIFCNILIFYNISIFYNIFHPLQLHTCQAFVNLVETCKHMTQLYQQDKDQDECKMNQGKTKTTDVQEKPTHGGRWRWTWPRRQRPRWSSRCWARPRQRSIESQIWQCSRSRSFNFH